MNKRIPKNNLYAVILAGGSGTRFWPLSRASNPKQFLKIAGNKSLLYETINRIKGQFYPANILIFTNAAFKNKVKAQIKSFKISDENIFLEPEGKNTAPAICWAASVIERMNPDAIMCVLPSDHFITNKAKFSQTLDRACALAQDNYLVTLGIEPNRPETGYGYLKIKTERGITRVVKFTEKPSLGVAKQFVKAKNYLWNSGMFIWKASVILDQFQEYLPNIYKPFNEVKDIHTFWSKLPSISIDYGILEKAHSVVAVSARDIGWSDLGSWESLIDILAKDKHGNIIDGDALQLGCANVFIKSHKRFVSVIGANNLIVIDTPDALLVCQKDMSQKVRDVVGFLKKAKRKEC